MDSILITLAIGIVGTLLAAIWTFVVGLAGAPGAIYTAIRTPDSRCSISCFAPETSPTSTT